MGGGDAAEGPPMVAVGSEADGGAAVAEDAGCEGVGAVGEDGVVSGEAVLGGGGRGDDDGGEAAEVELHHGAVLLGERLESAVGRGLQEVEVAEHRQRRRAWRRIGVLTWISVMVRNEEDANARKYADTTQENEHFFQSVLKMMNVLSSIKSLIL